MENKKTQKTIVKFAYKRDRKQRTINAIDIYDAERQIRRMFNVTERSGEIEIQTIKQGRTTYQVNGTTLG